VANRPVNFSDPTGHKESCGEDTGLVCKHADSILAEFGIKTSGLNNKQKWGAAAAAAASGWQFYKTYGNSRGFESAQDAFKSLHGDIFITMDPNRTDCLTTNNGSGGSNISCAKDSTYFKNGSYFTAFLHEFGHSMDIHFNQEFSSNLIAYDDLKGNPIDGGYGNPWIRTTGGFTCSDMRCLEHPPSLGYACDGGAMSFCARQEQFADIYMNWILDNTGDPYHGFTGSEGASRGFDFGNRLLPLIFNKYLGQP
jgi:hypothetical protein